MHCSITPKLLLLLGLVGSAAAIKPIRMKDATAAIRTVGFTTPTSFPATVPTEAAGEQLNATEIATSMATTRSAEPMPPADTLCNGYAELCDRKYGNITMVGAHNSPFARKNDIAGNQEMPVEDQLTDGIRFVQGQMQWPDKESKVPHFCHTACHIFDGGPITNWLGRVKAWLDENPREVVTILLGNGNFSPPDWYVPFIESTGIVDYAYVPPKSPLKRDEWPTLRELIDSNKRVIMFLDYKSNEQKHPWLLNEFGYMWETPMNPVIHHQLSCDVQRPNRLPAEAARERLHLLNHNMDEEQKFLAQKWLLPAYNNLTTSNAVVGHGSLGQHAAMCTHQWGVPPNILNVDYYNVGSFPGSVFEAAARINGVKYRFDCCGKYSEAHSKGWKHNKHKTDEKSLGDLIQIPTVTYLYLGPVLITIAITNDWLDLLFLFVWNARQVFIWLFRYE